MNANQKKIAQILRNRGVSPNCTETPSDEEIIKFAFNSPHVFLCLKTAEIVTDLIQFGSENIDILHDVAYYVGAIAENNLSSSEVFDVLEDRSLSDS